MNKPDREMASGTPKYIGNIHTAKAPPVFKNRFRNRLPERSAPDPNLLPRGFSSEASTSVAVGFPLTNPLA